MKNLEKSCLKNTILTFQYSPDKLLFNNSWGLKLFDKIKGNIKKTNKKTKITQFKLELIEDNKKGDREDAGTKQIPQSVSRQMEMVEEEKKK